MIAPRRRFLAAALVIGPPLGVVAAEVYATGSGEPGSMSGWAVAYAYYVAPMLAGVLLLSAVLCVPAILLMGSRESTIGRRIRTIGDRSLVAGVALWGAIYVAAPVRMHRLGAATAALDAQVTKYTAARSAGHFATTEPQLNVRGCDSLRVYGAEATGWELRSQCSRGLGNWDEIIFRPNGAYPQSRRFQRLGRWAYRWD